MANICQVTLHLNKKISKKKIKEFIQDVLEFYYDEVSDDCTSLVFGVKWSAECWLEYFNINEYFGVKNWELVSTEQTFAEHIYNIDGCYKYESREYKEVYVDEIQDMTYDEIMEEYGINPESIIEEITCLGEYEFEFL